MGLFCHYFFVQEAFCSEASSRINIHSVGCILSVHVSISLLYIPFFIHVSMRHNTRGVPPRGMGRGDRGEGRGGTGIQVVLQLYAKSYHEQS